MATRRIGTKQVDELRHLIEGVAKNFADRVYGPQGPEWCPLRRNCGVEQS